MNTDKIYAEQLANEYALKDTSKVIMKLFICLKVSQSLIYMKMLFIVLMESSWDGLKMVG